MVKKLADLTNSEIIKVLEGRLKSAQTASIDVSTTYNQFNKLNKYLKKNLEYGISLLCLNPLSKDRVSYRITTHKN